MTAYLVALGVPADLEDAAGALVGVHQLAALGAPDVHTPARAAQSLFRQKQKSLGLVSTNNSLVEAPTCQELSVWRECNTVDGFLVPE